MKKKTLLILLIVAITLFYITLIIRMTYFIGGIRTIIEIMTDDNSRLASLLKDLTQNSIKAGVELLLQLVATVIFTYITIELFGREQLTLKTEEELERKKAKKEKKKQDKILQLNAKVSRMEKKIEEIKKKDDE